LTFFEFVFDEEGFLSGGIGAEYKVCAFVYPAPEVIVFVLSILDVIKRRDGSFRLGKEGGWMGL